MPQPEISPTKQSFEFYTNALYLVKFPMGSFSQRLLSYHIKFDVYHLRTFLACCFKLFHIPPTNQF